MPNKKIRIVLDTNIWISYLISTKLIKLDQLLISNKLEFVFSEELITEFIEVTGKPKLKKYFKQNDVIALLDTLNNIGIIVEVKSKVNICRDFKDNFLLALCKDGRVDYLITGDEDLLTLKNFYHTKIVRYSTFIKLQQSITK